jgi:hypothetical protein
VAATFVAERPACRPVPRRRALVRLREEPPALAGISAAGIGERPWLLRLKNFSTSGGQLIFYGARRTLDELGNVLEQLTADAKSASLSLDDLNAAAGGNVVDYVRQALAKREAGQPAGNWD